MTPQIQKCYGIKMYASNTYFNGDIGWQDGLNLCMTMFIVNHCQTLYLIMPVTKELMICEEKWSI